MKTRSGKIKLSLLIVFACLMVVLVVLSGRFFSQKEDSPSQTRSVNRVVPVEAVNVMRGPIQLRRFFSGTLEARSEFVVAPKVSGRIERLNFNIGDPIEKGQVVGELDNEEYIQSVNQAKAEREVAKANLIEAQNALEIAGREMERFNTLRQRGVASEAQFDTVKANHLAKQSEVQIARAQVLRTEAALESARIRLGYTTIKAEWDEGDDQRIVAERYVDEGETVSANTPLLKICELNPILGVVFVTERDYGKLKLLQKIEIVTDAFPDRTFSGHVERIAPVFKQETRQARVELLIENPEELLKPGMYIRATAILDDIADATILPEKAITKRGDQLGIFFIDEATNTARWREVVLGIQDGDRVQIMDDQLSGRVVTLGQQFLDDGTPVTIPEELQKSSPKETENQ